MGLVVKRGLSNTLEDKGLRCRRWSRQSASFEHSKIIVESGDGEVAAV